MNGFNREEQIRALHSKRKQQTMDKVDEAIKRLTKTARAINFNSVATEAGISKATLYNHKDIKKRIEFLRNQQEQNHKDSRIKRDENNQNALNNALKRQIDKLKKRIAELEQENRILQIKNNERLAEYFEHI